MQRIKRIHPDRWKAFPFGDGDYGIQDHRGRGLGTVKAKSKGGALKAARQDERIIQAAKEVL